VLGEFHRGAPKTPLDSLPFGRVPAFAPSRRFDLTDFSSWIPPYFHLGTLPSHYLDVIFISSLIHHTYLDFILK
jgi:hypothetical protein